MSKKHNISIVMTTYNGERFLKEQLDSFLWQTRLPDELVVCDDGSTDRTLDILENFARTAPFPVKIFRNPQRLGFSKNFEKASLMCSGDLVAFSDQDDIWLPEKLEVVENIFRTDDEIGLLIHNLELVDNYNIKIIHKNMLKLIKLNNYKNNIYLYCIKDQNYNGNSIIVKSPLLEKIWPYPPF